MKKILRVVGARPNFMKIAPAMGALDAAGGFDQRLIHTGQHYDEKMVEIFFRAGLPRPDRDLEVGSGSQAEQTAVILIRFEEVLEEEVVGDVYSTLAASLVAAVAHVEAGLRSFDLSLPEEINRMVTDRLSSVLLAPRREATPT